jgi:hypothetical protein
MIAVERPCSVLLIALDRVLPDPIGRTPVAPPVGVVPSRLTQLRPNEKLFISNSLQRALDLLVRRLNISMLQVPEHVIRRELDPGSTLDQATSLTLSGFTEPHLNNVSTDIIQRL